MRFRRAGRLRRWRGLSGELEKQFGPEWAGLVEELRRRRSNGEEIEEGLREEVSQCLSRLRG